MKNILKILVLVLFIFSSGWSQTVGLNEFKTINIEETEQIAKVWLDDLFTWNVKPEGDNIIYNEEARRIISDTSYYNFIYPEAYTWPTTLALLEQRAIKQALWYMINIYGDDKTNSSPYIADVVVTLDHAIDMEKVLISSYYSYISFDPEVVKMDNGIIKEIIRPDIAEQKLMETKEIVNFVLSYRTQREQQKSKVK